MIDNPIRYLAQRLDCSTDDILDMSIEEMWRRILEVRAETAWLEAKIALLESIRDDVDGQASS